MPSYGLMHLDDIAVVEKSLTHVGELFGHRTDDPLRIVEIGIWDGSSTREMSQFITGTLGIKQYEHWTLDKCLLAGGLNGTPAFEGCKSLVGDSLDLAPTVPDGISLLLIDGCHCLYHVLGDFALYSPKVSLGGLILFHDVNPKLDQNWRQYQYHGDTARRESYVSVRMALSRLGLLPLRRRDYFVFAEGAGTVETWWGGMMAFKKLEMEVC